MKKESFAGLAKKILELPAKYRQKIVGIDGGGGAGKSTFTQFLQKELPGSVIIHVDDFYMGPWDKRLDHTNYVVNPLFDWDRFSNEVLAPVKKGERLQYHVYDWHKHSTDEVVAVPADAIILVEGVSTTQKRFAESYDYKIWVDAPEEVRLQRALARDGEHMRFLWEEDWLPVERNYVAKDNPASRADVVVKGGSCDFSTGIFELGD